MLLNLLNRVKNKTTKTKRKFYDLHLKNAIVFNQILIKMLFLCVVLISDFHLGKEDGISQNQN